MTRIWIMFTCLNCRHYSKAPLVWINMCSHWGKHLQQLYDLMYLCWWNGNSKFSSQRNGDRRVWAHNWKNEISSLETPPQVFPNVPVCLSETFHHPEHLHTVPNITTQSKHTSNSWIIQVLHVMLGLTTARPTTNIARQSVSYHCKPSSQYKWVAHAPFRVPIKYTVGGRLHVQSFLC